MHVIVIVNDGSQGEMTVLGPFAHEAAALQYARAKLDPEGNDYEITPVQRPGERS